MKLPYACPFEIWWEVIAFLCTRDIILLSHTCKYLYDVGEEARKKRQNIQRFLSTFIKDVDGFRRLMRRTGGILVGETATAFFTGASREKKQNVDLVLHNTNLESCANAFYSFLKGETITPAGRYPEYYFMDQKVCPC
jgi:hypothetical protein